MSNLPEWDTVANLRYNNQVLTLDFRDENPFARDHLRNKPIRTAVYDAIQADGVTYGEHVILHAVFSAIMDIVFIREIWCSSLPYNDSVAILLWRRVE